jgi:F420-dependent oxidoreductase-like protein
MSQLRAGLVIPRQSPTATLAAIERAEARGVQAVWSTVGGPAPDAVTIFAAAAVRTSRIGLGTSIVPTYPIHPIKLASQALAVADLAPGRFRLGVGPSHRPTIEGSFGLPMGKPLDHLREYVTILRGLLWEGKSEFSGEYYQVRTELAPNLPPPRLPIMISALRANAFRLAGEVSDGAISWICPVDYLVGTALPALRAGAEAAGRPVPPLVGHVPVAISTDRDAVRAAARAQFAMYARLPFYRNMFADAGFPIGPDNTLSDALIDALFVSGDTATVRNRLAAIQAAGVDDLLITHVPIQDAAAEVDELADILAS